MNAKEYLESKGIFGLDTKKRYNEVIGWMEGYAQEVVKNCSIPAVMGRSEHCIVDKQEFREVQKYFEEVCKEYKRLLDAEYQQLNLQNVMANVSDILLLKAKKYEDEANADFDTEGVQHNLNIGRYDGLMQAIQEINKHLP